MNANIIAVEAKELTKDVTLGQSDNASHLNILKGVNLQVTQGETLAILGGSGSGKTTLLSILAGLDSPTSGENWIDGQRLNDLNENGRAALRAGRVGFVFQSFQLLPGFSALENVMLGAELAGHDNAAERAHDTLASVGLAARIHHPPNKLSGGEQQRVAIARAFAGKPSILFADEPTGNLDTETGEHIIDLLFELNRSQGTTLILVTHDDQLAKRCQRVLRLKDGQLHA